MGIPINRGITLLIYYPLAKFGSFICCTPYILKPSNALLVEFTFENILLLQPRILEPELYSTELLVTSAVDNKLKILEGGNLMPNVSFMDPFRKMFWYFIPTW